MARIEYKVPKGAGLPPSPVPLEGVGKTMRHLKIYDAAQVKRLPVAALIKEAVALDAADNAE